MTRKYIDVGLLVIRLGLGPMFVFHGLPKLMAGGQTWDMLGSNMSYFGLTTHHYYWGLAAAITEMLGGLLLILGIAFRPAAAGLFAVMAVAVTMHLRQDGAAWFQTASHAIEAAIVFAGLAITGPGELRIRVRPKAAQKPKLPHQDEIDNLQA